MQSKNFSSRILHRRFGILACASVLGAFLAVGCQRPEATESPFVPAAESVTIFAAASTTEALDAALAEFRERRPDGEIKTSYGATSALAQQAVNGATVHLFLSADEKWMQFLAEKQLVAESKILLGNSLVLVVPAESKLALDSLEGLAGDEIKSIALADPEHVPAGRYAKNALEAVGLWSSISKKIVSGNDVRRALSFVETGAADAGIVYATDAKISKKARVVAQIPTAQSGSIDYPLALLKAGKDIPLARELYEFLFSESAADIFHEHGFRAGEALNVAVRAPAIRQP